jgi:hypothetical protein
MSTALGLRDQFVKQLESFRTNICGQRRYTGDVALWPAQAFDKPCFNRVQAGLENNRNCCCCCLCRKSRGGTSGRDNHGNLTADKISRQRRQSIGLAIGPAEFDRDIAALVKARRAEALTECGQTGRIPIRRFTAEISDHWHCRLLRTRRERPHRRTAEKRDEIAPLHVPLRTRLVR